MNVELANVHKSFGGIRALQGISLSIPSGRKVALIGPNGSGKSTLIRGMLGIVSCSGDFHLDGRSPFRERAELAQRIAYVPQNPPQLAARVIEVVRMACQVRGIERSSVERAAEELEFDLKREARQPVKNLSGGMKQKLMIALALAADASLLVMDEPTGSLDVGARTRFFQSFGSWSRDATLFLSSHRLEEIQHLVDYVVALENGRIAWQGPADAFLASRSAALIEVDLAEGGDVEWLKQQGFSPGARTTWFRIVARREKLGVLSDLMSRSDKKLSNIVVRDLDTVEASEAVEQ